MRATTEIRGHYRIDTDEQGMQTVTYLKEKSTWSAGHISDQGSADDAVDDLLELQAMREEEGE